MVHADVLARPPERRSGRSCGQASRGLAEHTGYRRYGDLMPAQRSGVDATLSGFDLRVGTLMLDDNRAGRKAYDMVEREEAIGVSLGLKLRQISIHDADGTVVVITD